MKCSSVSKENEKLDKLNCYFHFKKLSWMQDYMGRSLSSPSSRHPQTKIPHSSIQVLSQQLS